MTNVISFRNIESEAHLRDFVDSYLDQTVGTLLQNRPLRAKVIIEKNQSKNGHHERPDFSCEIVLYHPGIKNQVVVRKTTSSFYKSVREACRTVEKSLRRLTQTRSKQRHRNFENTQHLTLINQQDDRSDI